MNILIISDIFRAHIKQLLYPLDLHHLSISCKSYAQYISIKDIEQNTIIQIEKQLMMTLGNNYDKFKDFFVQNADITNPIITGSIITRAIIGETWSDEIETYAFVNGFACNDTIAWEEFIEKIDNESKVGFFIGDTDTSYIKCFDKIRVSLVNAHSLDNQGKYNRIVDCYCYKFNNQLAVSNIQTLLAKQIDVKIFFHDLPMILKYHKFGFKFYDDRLLSNEDLFAIFIEREYRYQYQIKRGEQTNSQFVCGYEYYKLLDDDRDNWWFHDGHQEDICHCNKAADCFVHVLSPNTKHFHHCENNGILIIKE